VGKLSRSLVQSFREGMLSVGAGWRAYFAPYNKTLGFNSTTAGPYIVDLTTGPFDQNQVLPTGFFDLGWIKDFKLTPQSKIGVVRSGYRGAVRAIYRGEVGEQFEFKFREYGRLQYKLATGTNIVNLLDGTSPSPNTSGPLSASGSPITGMTTYSVVNGVGTLSVGSASGLAIGNYIVCDVDYNFSSYGIVGDAGTPVFQNAVTDIDYIRKNSDYVARIANINGTTVTLDQPFAGGGSGATSPVVPQAGSKIQVVLGWTAREGGTFVSEWSGLFLLDTIDQAQIAVYYPHVAIAQNRDVAATWAIENVGTTDEGGFELDAMYQALAYDDPLDGETVVAYKAYYAKPNQSSY
jgi:hypothetical protein